MKQYKSVFEIDNYIKAVKFLQEKYDKLGYVRQDYYHMTTKGTLTKTSGIGLGKLGLQYHHVCENEVPSLSDKAVAEKYFDSHPEYQSADNMCYCNLLEHAWLHLLITENNTDISDDIDEAITGKGGVQWLILALNSIMSNSDTSYYSTVDEDGHGCNYNYNNIIIDNKKDYDKLINRFCTSAFIRQRLSASPSELAGMLCKFTKRDNENIDKLISHIISLSGNTLLKDWNINAYADLESYLRKDRTAIVWICTGGGKTTTGLEYIRVHNCRALVICPTDTVKDSWTSSKNCDVITYQAFRNNYSIQDYSKYGVIICDEVHHADAPEWGKGLQFVLDNTSLKIIGLTATPTEEQLNGTDKYFGGRLCIGLELAEGIKSNYIYPFGYIQSIYKMEDVKDDFDKYGPVGTELWGKLNVELNKMPVVTVLRKHMPVGQRKIIVFCACTEDIPYAISTMKEYDPNMEVRDISSKKAKEYNNEAKDWFNNETIKNVCLVAVGMVNEGAHYNGVNTLVMFRRTKSSTLYLQQLGRIVVTTDKHTDPKGIVFDFTNNAESLIANQEITIYRNDADDKSAEESIKKLKAVIKEKAVGKEIIYQDYTNDCAATLAALADARDINITNTRIYTEFDILKNELINNEFTFELWEKLKCSNNVQAKIKNAGGKKHASNRAIAEAASSACGNATSKKVAASDIEKIATAFKISIRRLYNFGFISFTDNNTCDMIVNDEDGFKTTIESVGFKSANTYKLVVEHLKRTAYILANTIE